MPPPSPSSDRATIRDVARQAGVSHQTVSRVLNGHPSIRDATRERVLQAISALNYRPSRAARALATRRSHAVGVLVGTAGSFYGPVSSLAAVEAAARAAGYFVTIATVPVTEDDEAGTEADLAAVAAALDRLVDQAVEGVVAIAPRQPVLDALRDLRLPVPFVTLPMGLDEQSPCADPPTGSSADPADQVVDQAAAVSAAVAHLLSEGHRRIAHLAGPQDWLEAQVRRQGFRAAVQVAGLELLPTVSGDWSASSGYRLGPEVFATGATAVVCGNDQMALGLLHAAAEAGIDVPGRLSVVGFDDVPEAAHYRPALTTVRQDFAALGGRCIERLRCEIDGTAPEGVTPLVPQLIVRASTAPPVTD